MTLEELTQQKKEIVMPIFLSDMVAIKEFCETVLASSESLNYPTDVGMAIDFLQKKLGALDYLYQSATLLDRMLEKMGDEQEGK